MTTQRKTGDIDFRIANYWLDGVFVKGLELRDLPECVSISGDFEIRLDVARIKDIGAAIIGEPKRGLRTSNGKRVFARLMIQKQTSRQSAFVENGSSQRILRAVER